MRRLKAQLMGMVSGKSQTPLDSTYLPDSATFLDIDVISAFGEVALWGSILHFWITATYVAESDRKVESRGKSRFARKHAHQLRLETAHLLV